MSDSGRPACQVVRAGESYVGKQGLTYRAGLTGASVGARDICMTVAVVPPGGRARPHLHRGIETAVYVIEGEFEMRWGEGLESLLRVGAGEYLYIAADVPHLAMNNGDRPCVAVVAHSAADDQEGIEFVEE